MSPGRIALGYAVIAMLWILFSDAVVTRLNLSSAAMTIKGSFFVFVTATLLYLTVRRLVQAVQRTSEALRRSNRELRAISNCNQVLLRATDEQSLLKEICRIVCEEAGYLVAWVGYAEHDEGKSVRPVAWTGTEEDTLAKLGITWADTELGRGPAGTAIRTGETSCLEDYATDIRGAPWRESAVQHGFRCAIALPLKDEHHSTFGSLTIYAALPDAFTPDEIRLLEELADDLAFGIVTLRSRAARQRAEQEVFLLNFALDRVREAVFLIDEQGRCQYANESGSLTLGYSRADFLGLCVADWDPDFPAVHWSDHWRELKEQQSLTFESRNRTREGRVFPVEVSANYFEYEGLAYNLALVRDITERKRAEEALRRSEAYLAEAERISHTGSWAWQPGGVIGYWSKECYRIMGFNPAEGVPPLEKFLEGVHPEDLPRVRERLHQVAQEKAEYQAEYRIVRPGGEVRDLQVIGHPVFDSAGNLIEYVGTTTDVTDRKRAEEEVRNTAAQWQATFDAVQDLVLLLDKDFRILRANRAATEFLGQPFDKIVGGHCFNFVHGTCMPPATCPLAKMRQSRRHEEMEVLAREGGPWLLVSVDPVFDQNGELIQVVHVVRDITERKRTEDAMRRSEAYLAEGQRLAHMGSWAWNPASFQPLYWSEEMSRIYGLNPEDGVPTAETWWQCIHTEDRDRTRELLEKAAAGNMDYEHDLRIVLPDGTIKHIHAVGHPVHDEGGKLVEYFGTAMDVTERKRAEEALQRSEANLAEGQRLARMGSWAWDPATHQALYWSGEMYRIFGLNPQDGVPTPEAFRQRLHPEDRDDFRELMIKVAQQSMDYEHDHRIVLADGTIKHIHAVGHPVLDENGQLVEYVGTAMDVTERKLAEDELHKYREHLEDLVKQRTEQLAEAKARAEAANRAKSMFLANMSHELRTPLNAVLGFSRLLKNDPDVTPPQQETLDVIVRSGEHLLNLINNVLDMAKIESGRAALKESEVDLNRLLHEIQSLMGVGAVEKGLRFTMEDDPDLPRFVAVDAGRLRQVLMNLLGNAIKYTDSGGVKLRARLARIHGAEKALVRFEVEDSGPGISHEDCQRIFIPFVQLDDQTPAQAGTGLGLGICKQYVELMGGRIGVNSQPGKGSVFYFEIPVSILSSVAERDELKHPRILGLVAGQPGYRLLIVEDQPENRLLLRRLLDPLGFELREAANGREAVALFEQWHPDLIWMDIRMPVMDGLEAARRIRATQAGADTKIIALTAHALEEEKEPIMAAGCDDLIRKPFHEQEIFGALARHLRLKFIYETTPRVESTPEPPELALNPEQIDALPAELRGDLRQAVIELDTDRTQILIGQVAGRDAALGRALSTLAMRLDYPRLLKLLENARSPTGEM